MSHHEQVQPGDNIPHAGPGTEATRRDVVQLWTGILTGPVLWFAQQQICFVLVPWVCTHGGVIWLHLVTLVCLLGTCGAGLLAFTIRRREQHEHDLTPGQQRVHFMATLGVLSSLFFSALIVAQGIPNFVFDPCQR